MLEKADLDHILTDIESDRVERTVSLSDTDKFCEAICAFANDLPNHKERGFLIIGVDNGGIPQGRNISDQLLQNLGALRSDGNIQPLPVISVEKHVFNTGEIAVVIVQPSDMPPVRYKGKVWIRVGPRCASASEQDERVLSEKRFSAAKSFDAVPCRDAQLEDMSRGQFEAYRQSAVSADVVAENHRSIEQQLGSLRMFDLQSNCPTNAGMILFAKNPRFYFPGAYVQFPSAKWNRA